MKNFLLLFLFVCFGMIFLSSESLAQVIIESTGTSQDITAPAHDIVIAELKVIVIPEKSYTLDSCWLTLHGTISQVISNLRFNRSDRSNYDPYMSWASIQSNHWLSLGEIYNFPPQQNDTTSIVFTADIGINVLPIIGSVISISLQCSGFSPGHEEIVTNTVFSSAISVSSINGIKENQNQSVPVFGGEGKIFVYKNPISIFDGNGKTVLVAEQPGIYAFTAGYYLWQQKVRDKITYGSLVVR